MPEVKALSFIERQCGKHLADTKKRFVWNFEIDGKGYALELINSTLSGKRTVLLNLEQIYHEKDLFNIDFDFSHMIEGHSFRISRTEDNLNKFQLRIDNRTFDEVRLGYHSQPKQNKSKQFSSKSADPFAQFESFASSNPAKQVKSNAFGDFDFDSFSKPSTIRQVKSGSSIVDNKPSTVVKSNSLLDFDFNAKKEQIPVNDFQTNVFQTKNGGGFSDFANSFKQNEKDLMDEDESQFATNSYANRNHYLDLKTGDIQSNKYLGDDIVPPVEEKKDKTFKQNFSEIKQSAGLATKKAVNAASMKFNQIKKVVKGYSESLI